MILSIYRGVRQLGTAHYVFPGAKHTRWEHSIGVMHLAGKFVEHLRYIFPHKTLLTQIPLNHLKMFVGPAI